MAETTLDNYDDEDVEAALARKTDDGPGDEEPPAEDFVAFATDDVEEETA